jgi:16S rRNA (uracil1498-N3)-methyltransferase
LNGAESIRERAAAAAQVFVDDLDSLQIAEADAHHLFTVRRLRDGEIVIAADGVGGWRRCIVEDRALGPAGERVLEPLASPPLEVGFAPVKGDRSEWAVAKLTEIGINRIVALATERAAVRWSPNAAEKALERWRRVAREAACQSRHVRLPEVLGPIPVAEWGPKEGTALAVPGGGPVGSEIHRVLIGPEGGFSEDELASCSTHVGLAGGVLRTETAAVAAGVFLEGLRGGTVAAVKEIRP